MDRPNDEKKPGSKERERERERETIEESKSKRQKAFNACWQFSTMTQVVAGEETCPSWASFL